jgi:phage/plasmid-associated DNA primase
MSKNDTDARPDIIKLKNKRAGFISEPPKNSVIDGSVIKKLTGGDQLSQRAIFSNDYQDFECGAKIFIMANTDPKLERDLDPALCNRLVKIPFNTKFVQPQSSYEPHERPMINHFDKMIPYEGFLKWCVDGAVLWYEHGRKIKLCEASIMATKNLINDSDIFGWFFEDRMEKGVGQMKAVELWNLWLLWCEDEGINPGSNQKFGRVMSSKLEHKKTSGCKMYMNIKPKSTKSKAE